jgi:predicted O-methyltransferase YrrM
MIVDERVENYIRNLIPQQSEAMEALKAYADNFLVPIVHPEVGTLLRVLCKMHQPKRILEVGTAIGYSALLMDHACNYKATIDTLELSPEMVRHARQNIESFGATSRMTVYEGDAAVLLKTLVGPYDLIFIDAAKGQYLEYLDSCIPLMKAGTLLVSDNVLFKGMVATNELLVKRKVTLVKRLRTYLDRIMHHDQMDSTIIPIADGVALSIWKGQKNED